MDMEYVDVHCHLNSSEFDLDREGVIERAKKAGVVAIIDCGESMQENEKIRELSKQYPIVKPAFGHSPENLNVKDAEADIGFIRKHKDVAVAIGEVGLDYWKVKEEPEREIQRKILSMFVDLAKELDLPLIVHSRSAGKYTIELLKEKGAKKVCMHAFDGSLKNAMLGVEAGFYFSIPPSIVRSEQKQKLVKGIPLENLLLETDSPLLGPTAEERNEPANIDVAATKISFLRAISEKEAVAAFRENTRRFCGL
jgi:TatD DNase family protein